MDLKNAASLFAEAKARYKNFWSEIGFKFQVRDTNSKFGDRFLPGKKITGVPMPSGTLLIITELKVLFNLSFHVVDWKISRPATANVYCLYIRANNNIEHIFHNSSI